LLWLTTRLHINWKSDQTEDRFLSEPLSLIEMSAFNFNLCDDSKCVSKDDTTCLYDEGRFDFDQCEITVGNSLENNYGGIGGFVGPEHEYFLYCGSKYAEIAYAKFNAHTDEWEDHECLQWWDLDDDGDDGFFKEIWFTKEEPALIFVPWKKYRRHLLAHEKFRNSSKTKAYIKLDLSTGRFKSINEKQFSKQKHSVLDENSEWPSPHEDLLSGDTLVEVSRPIPTQQATVLKVLEHMRTQIDKCLDGMLQI
jgi:hypothetical protein